MLLFLLGLAAGAILGYLSGKSTVQKPRFIRQSSSSRGAFTAADDPVSDLINEMQVGVSLLAENQRNCNMREWIKIKSDRRKLERADRA